MRMTVLAVLAAASATSANSAERRHIVTDFDRVQVDGPFRVTLATGRPASAAVSGSSAAIERVTIDVQGRTLRVRANRSAWGGYPGEGAGPLQIALSTHEIRGASVSGSGSLNIDKARAMRFDLAVSGTGRIGLGQVEADSLTLGLLGSGAIEIGGRAKELRATVQGNGDLRAEKLMVEDARIIADTAGAIKVAVGRAAEVTATGPGDTHIIGNAACTVRALGSGEVRCGD